ncbi:MAG: hypothetical protein WDA27_07625 [Actinomycetota bacterium]
MKRITLVLAVVLMALPAMYAIPAPASADFRVGAAAVDVSPSKLVDLATQRVCLGGFGIGCSRPATGERETLYARAIVIESGGSKVAIATSSNIGLFAKYKDEFGPAGAYDVRLAASQATGIPSSSIMITSDHSHSSPDVEGIWGGVDPEYLRKLATGLIQAIYEANRSLEPAELYVGAATYEPSNPDELKNHWDGTGGVLDQIDRELRVFQARRADETVIATLINFSPHASVLDEESLASGDWTGTLANNYAVEHGGVALGMVGALGGIGARFDEDEFDEFLVFVDGLADRAMASATRIETPGVAAGLTFIREPLTAPILYAAYVPMNSQHPANVIEASIDRSVMHPWATGAVMGTHVSAIRVGDVLFGGTPGEAYPEISFALSRGVTASEHFIFGLTNDQVGYLISPLEGVPTPAQNGALYPAFGNDNWALSVSPTIGEHVSCTLRDIAGGLGFQVEPKLERCSALTATDGLAPPPELP